MFTLEIVVPKQHVPEKFDKYISSSRIKVKETGELVKLSKSSLPKIIALKSVTVNGQPFNDKGIKVKPNDHIVIKLSNIDQYKVQSSSKDGLDTPKESNNIKNSKQTAWWDKDEYGQPTQREHQQQIKKQNNQQHQQHQQQIHNNKKVDLVSTNIKLDVLYEDDNLAVINKPAGMLVHPSSTQHTVVLNKEDQTHTLVNALLYRYGSVSKLSSIGGPERPGIVHRLDKDTAGIIIIARNNDTHSKLQTLFEEHTNQMIKNTQEDDSDQDADDHLGGDDGDEDEYYADDSDDDQEESEDEINIPESVKYQRSIARQGKPARITTNYLQKLMENKIIPTTIQKKYHCIVLGKPKEVHGFINKKIARHPGDKNKMVIDEKVGKEALTEYKLLKVWENVNVQVLDNQKNLKTSNLNINSSNNSSSNSTLSEYDNVLNQLNKNKKKNKKSVSSKNSNLNSKMSFLSVESEDDEDEDKEEEEEEDSDEDAIYIDSEDDEDDEDDEDYEDEDDEDDEDDEISNEKENYDEILSRLQRTKSIGSNTFSLLEITLHTGRSHQIRVHMASENLPIVGDPIYSSKSKQFLVSHLLLASVYLKFKHPILNEIKEFTIDHPQHFKQFIDSIENNNSNNKEIEKENIKSSSSKQTVTKPTTKATPIPSSSSKSINTTKSTSTSSKTPSRKVYVEDEDNDIMKRSSVSFTQKLPTSSNNSNNNNNNNNKNKKKNNNYSNDVKSKSEQLEKDLLSSFI